MSLTNLIPQKIFSIEAYKNLLIRLLPRGPIWNSLSVTTKLLFEALAVEYDRVDTRFVDLQREAIAGLSVELLSDWEAEAGITPLSTDTTTIRQNRVHARLNSNFGNPTKTFFENYALSAFGIVMVISYGSDPMRCGTALCGDELETTGGTFVFTVTVSSDPNSKLAELQAFINQMKPAHTYALYA